MKSLVTFAFLISLPSWAQTFAFPHDEKNCKATEAICATLSEIQKQIPVDVFLKTLEIKDRTVLINGHSPGYSGIGKFIENLKLVSGLRKPKLVKSTSSGLDANKKRIEFFQLDGKLAP